MSNEATRDFGVPVVVNLVGDIEPRMARLREKIMPDQRDDGPAADAADDALDLGRRKWLLRLGLFAAAAAATYAAPTVLQIGDRAEAQPMRGRRSRSDSDDRRRRRRRRRRRSDSDRRRRRIIPRVIIR